MPTPVELLRSWVLDQAGDAASWAREQLDVLATGASRRDLHIFLGLAPRRLGKADLALGGADFTAAGEARPGWRVAGWSVDGAARVLALLVYRDGQPFAERFSDLRRTADAGELVALYRGLPLYPDPESLSFEAGEGLRSNMRMVFEAIAHNSPYPREQFDEHRWNHMILKALFVGSRLAPIQGLDERGNPELARILREYAHERWAAGRPVPPELWRCVGPFATDEAAIADLRRALAGSPPEARAAALALTTSPSGDARALLNSRTEAAAIESGNLTWETFDKAA